MEPMNQSEQRRVVITGMGVIAPNGQDLASFWHTVRDGVSAADRLTRFEVAHLPTRIAAQIEKFDAGRYLDAKKRKRLDLHIQYGLAAARCAISDAGIDIGCLDAERIGLIEGASTSGLESAFGMQQAYLNRGYQRMSPFYLINAYSGSGSAEIALDIGIKESAITCSTGSASATDAIGLACSVIQHAEADLMLAGGAEAPLLAPIWGVFCRTNIMTTRNKTPQEAMRPFDRTRDGFLLGEGAGFLVLEDLSHARRRGARIHAEVVGTGSSCDAYHPTALHPDGEGMYRAMQKALGQAQLKPSEVDYINAHGTATEANEVVETRAIKRLFGEHAYSVSISSTKPVTGHLLGASGAIETIVCALTLQHQEAPPTINLSDPEEACDLDYIPQTSRPRPITVAMNVSSGFGGRNACLILKKYSL